MPDSETLIRNAYDLAAAKDIPGWVNAFAQDGRFTDMSTGVTYRRETLGDLAPLRERDARIDPTTCGVPGGGDS